MCRFSWSAQSLVTHARKCISLQVLTIRSLFTDTKTPSGSTKVRTWPRQPSLSIIAQYFPVPSFFFSLAASSMPLYYYAPLIEMYTLITNCFIANCSAIVNFIVLKENWCSIFLSYLVIRILSLNAFAVILWIVKLAFRFHILSRLLDLSRIPSFSNTVTVCVFPCVKTG